MNTKQFQITVVNRTPHIRSLVIEDSNRFLIVVCEANLNDPSAYAGKALDAAVEKAASKIARPLSSKSPEEMANALARVILGDESYRKDIGAVFLAAVYNGGDEQVSVCTAGDIRIQAVKDAKVLHTTRDHTAVADDQEGTYRDLSTSRRDLLKRVPTRAVPSLGKQPECDSWNVRRPATITISSSVLHQYREPTQVLSFGDAPSQIPELAFFASIRLP